MQIIIQAIKGQFVLKATLTGVKLGGGRGASATPIFLYLRIFLATQFETGN
jgi:hypothetical protein